MENKEVQVIGQRYVLIDVLGKGAFGSVYRAKDIKNNDKLVAVKRVSKEMLNKTEYLKEALHREIEIMNLIKCENSLQIIDVIQTTSNYNLVLEICDGDIDDWLNKHKGYITEDELREILLGLNNAFKIMDEKNIAHRDLKLKNILFVRTDREDYKESKIIPKLADYGFSKVVDENDMTSTRLGSPITMAPEIHNGQPYTTSCDIWSMGIIIYQLLYKTMPFKAKNEFELKLQISKFVKLKLPDGFSMSKELYDLVSKMLIVDPNRRITWEDYFKHPFFKVEKKNNKVEDIKKNTNLNNNVNDKNNKETDMEKFERKYGPARKLTDDPNGGYLISKAKSKIDGQFVFIKEYDRLIIDSIKEYKDIFDFEINLLKKISLDEKVKNFFPILYDFFVTESKYIVITDYFEGKPLENYLNKRSLLEDFTVLEIINQIIPALEYFNTNKIVLPSFTTKSLWFHSYKDEKNFKIKFFDLGTSKIYNDPSFERAFSLLEEPSEKTNVLNFGLILYRLCLGQNLFEFSINEDPKQTIQKSKII